MRVQTEPRGSFRGAPTAPQPRFRVSGTVGEVDAGPIAGARIYAESGGHHTTTAGDGSFSLSTTVPGTLRFSADGFEESRLTVTTSEQPLHARMRRTLVVGVDASVSFSLSRSDPGQDNTMFGDSWCEPCKVIRIQAASPGQIDVTVRWNSAAVLALWDPGARAYTAARDGESAFTASVSMKAGETIVYVGAAAYMGPPILEPMVFEVITRTR